MYTKALLKRELNKLGIPVVEGKVLKSDIRKVLFKHDCEAEDSITIKGVRFEFLRLAPTQWNPGAWFKINGQEIHAIKQGGMNLWAFPSRPELERRLGQECMEQLDQWLGSKLSGEPKRK